MYFWERRRARSVKKKKGGRGVEIEVIEKIMREIYKKIEEE